VLVFTFVENAMQCHSHPDMTSILDKKENATLATFGTRTRNLVGLFFQHTLMIWCYHDDSTSAEIHTAKTTYSYSLKMTRVTCPVVTNTMTKGTARTYDWGRPG